MSFLPRFLTRDWKLKLAALVLALLLWTSLRVEALDRQTLPSVPVRVQLNDPQWAVRSEPVPATVEVHFSGPTRELFSLYLDRPTVTIPIDKVASADTSVLLRPEWVRLPNRPNVTVDQIQPRAVSLEFEPITQAVAPVAIRTTGSLPPDLAFARPLATDPEVVRISGPASQVELVDSVPIHPIDLGRITATGSRRLDVDTAGMYGLVISPGQVRVDYTVEKEVERTLDGVPIVPPEGQGKVQLEPATTSLTLRGARELVQSVEPRSVWLEVPAVELRGMQPGEERRVSAAVQGLAPLLEAQAGVDSVTARLPSGGGS